jgi:hypothetical protein
MTEVTKPAGHPARLVNHFDRSQRRLDGRHFVRPDSAPKVMRAQKRRPERVPSAEPQGAWQWAPEREVVTGRPGNSLSDVLARCKALYHKGDDQ